MFGCEPVLCGDLEVQGGERMRRNGGVALHGEAGDRAAGERPTSAQVLPAALAVGSPSVASFKIVRRPLYAAVVRSMTGPSACAGAITQQQEPVMSSGIAAMGAIRAIVSAMSPGSTSREPDPGCDFPVGGEQVDRAELSPSCGERVLDARWRLREGAPLEHAGGDEAPESVVQRGALRVWCEVALELDRPQGLAHELTQNREWRAVGQQLKCVEAARCPCCSSRGAVSFSRLHVFLPEGSSPSSLSGRASR